MPPLSARRVALLLLGAFLARGRRTVTSWIRAAKLGDKSNPATRPVLRLTRVSNLLHLTWSWRRIIAYCLMSNHFHMALWPRDDGDLSRWMHWLLTTHVRRYLRHDHSSGHVWQGRFKAFPIQADNHLRVVLRSIERNPLRADLVERAERWRWSSLTEADPAPPLDPGPAPRGEGWIEGVNAVMTEAECDSIRESIRRDRPWGSAIWVREAANFLGLESSLRDRGRPRREAIVDPGVS